MSWRLLLFTLLLLAGTATLGGLYAGDWLVEHAPKQAKIKIMSENDPAPAVTADGAPMLRQPAQPLVSGKLGIPSDLLTPILWQFNHNNVSSIEIDDAGTTHFLSTRPVISDTVTTSSTSRIISTRPIGTTTEAPSGADEIGWLAEFNQRMKECRQLGFGKRGECVRETRSYYCGNHNAWGQLADCPAH